MGELIAVLSGKGGTGKTSVCAGLATALASLGESVLCIDCDIGLRNLDIALGLADANAISFLEVCRGDYELSAALRHPQYPGLAFLTAPVNCTPEDIDRQSFQPCFGLPGNSINMYFWTLLPVWIWDSGFVPLMRTGSSW